jgi:hypothetical protein
MKSFRQFLEEERLDELSRRTLVSYVKKSASQIAHHSANAEKMPKGDKDARDYHKNKAKKRLKGVKKAASKLRKGHVVVVRPAAKPRTLKQMKKPKDGLGHQGIASLITRGISKLASKGVKAIAKRI